MVRVCTLRMGVWSLGISCRMDTPHSLQLFLHQGQVYITNTNSHKHKIILIHFEHHPHTGLFMLKSSAIDYFTA